MNTDKLAPSRITGNAPCPSRFDGLIISSELLRQFVYCRRIPFFRLVMGFYPRKTAKMQYSEREHSKFQEEKRRTQADLDAGGLYFNFRVSDREHDWLAIIDEVEVQQREDDGKLSAMVTEYKYGKIKKEMFPHHKAQLCFQGLLLERNYPVQVLTVGVFNPATEEKCSLAFMDDHRAWTYQLIKLFYGTIANETFPRPARAGWKCTNCEYWIACLRA